MIHQDFRLTGTGPIIEVFSDRIEITNPGTPLTGEDAHLRSECLLDLLIRAEVFQLPPPRFDVSEEHTKATLYAPRSLAEMDKEDRVRACYQHACLRYVSNDQMTNTSLRERFAIPAHNYSIASRIIAETMDAKLIKRADPESTLRKHARYVPFWA